MEYIVSNVKIPGAIQLSSNLWVKGEFKEQENIFYLIEGYIVDRHVASTIEYIKLGLENNYANGAYNIFSFNKLTGCMEIKTDKRTTIPLYVYEKENCFAFSNNPWLLVKLFSDNISISTDSFKSQLLYFADVHPTRTLFTNVNRVDGATYIKFDSIRNIKKSCNYWSFTYVPNDNIATQDVLEKVDSDFSFYFDSVRKQNEGKIAGFGCSGGLDSRIIAHYIHKTGIRCNAYVFGEKHPYHFLQSTTAKTSEMIGHAYGFKVDFIPYQAERIMQSLILDIRNSPFIYTQMYINPSEDMPPVDYIFAGDPGGLAYMADYVLANDPQKLKTHADFFIGYRQWAITGLTSVLRKAMEHLHIPYNKYSDSGFIGLSHSIIDRIIDVQTVKQCREELDACIESFGGDNSIEKWIRIHDKINTKYQYSSGYASICHTKRCYQLYYPFFYDTIATIPSEYFRNKSFLKKIIEYINPDLLKIPDQNLNMIYGIDGVFNKLRNRIEIAARGRGLSFLHLLKSPTYKRFATTIFKRDNPIFYSVVNKNKLFESDMMTCYAGANYLKLKMLLDIFYYNEIDLLLSNNFYEKPGW